VGKVKELMDISLNIRTAGLHDLAAITDIYNEPIVTTTASFDIREKTAEEQESWFSTHGSQYPILVAEQDDTIIGWASMSPWSDRHAYAETAEASLYIKKEYRGRGVVRELSRAILQAGKQAGLHTAIARIAEGNDISIDLAESLGFQHIGVMKEVGKKFGKLLDVYIMQIIFD
jgi:L-amino acid N-acyltransferase YncA